MNKVIWFKTRYPFDDDNSIRMYFNNQEYFISKLRTVISFPNSLNEIKQYNNVINQSYKQQAHPLLQQLAKKFESDLYQELLK